MTPWTKSPSAVTKSKLAPPGSTYLSKYENAGSSSKTGIDDRKLQRPRFGGSTGVTPRSTSKEPGGNYNNHRSELPRLKTTAPPISYRGIRPPASRSRDPSPANDTRSTSISTSSSSYKLAPPPPQPTSNTFRRSVSKERTSKEDLSSPSSSSSLKYITSRFLPKNTIERSNYTGFPRTSSSLAKANETSRKNREFLNVISTSDSRRSRSISQCSLDEKRDNVSRNTSPNRSYGARTEQVQRKCSPAKIPEPEVRTEFEDSKKWSSILELKFNPGKKISRSSSNSNSHSCIPELKQRKLPPQIPAHQNKDFRKSVLNMSDGTKKKINGRRSASLSSADSESSDTQATDISESLNSNSYKPPTHEDGNGNNGVVSVLTRALPTIPNDFFKTSTPEDTAPVKWALDSSDSSVAAPKIRHVQSGEIPWWLDENAEVPEGVQTYPETVIRRNDSGKIGWWLDSSSESKNSPPKTEFQEYVVQKDENGRVLYKIRRNDSSNLLEWWKDSEESIAPVTPLNSEHFDGYQLRHIDSGERNQWCQEEPWLLGDRASPEGVEMPKSEDGRLSPYDNVPETKPRKNRPGTLFISKHTDIDDILGSSKIWSPLMEQIFNYQITPSDADCARKQYVKLDDAALQLYKDGDYGSYLDLDASISEQQEEFEGFQLNKKNSIVLRTQLSVRVHTIIEKLLTSEGRELRRALFSLKQIFQEDKDLVHEFVQNDGLSCLIKVGSEADQNYQNYILRALGQVMLYVDGMNGVMEHNQTIQWLYSLISSKFRLVVKTALKLLLVFVEYTDSNCMLLVKAVRTVDCTVGLHPWNNIMKLLRDFDSADTELLIYATTLINKVLNGVPDQDTYYDQTDALEEQGIELIIQRYMSKPGTDLDLLQQFQIYEAVLQFEDGQYETNGSFSSNNNNSNSNNNSPFRLLDENVKKTLRCRKSVASSGATVERRKSRRHSTGTLNNNKQILNSLQTNITTPSPRDDDDNISSSSSSSHSETGNAKTHLNGAYKDKNQAREAGVTPALRQRRERAERQRSFLKQQQDHRAKILQQQTGQDEPNNNNNNSFRNPKDLTPLLNAVNKLQDSDEPLKPWILLYNDEASSVKDITQKLSNLTPPSDVEKTPSTPRICGDMSGLISKAMEGLARSKSKPEVPKQTVVVPAPEPAKKTENELRWEELALNLRRSLNLCDMDFTDLGSDDEVDVLGPSHVLSVNVPPPPPPPLLNQLNAPPLPPPPLANNNNCNNYNNAKSSLKVTRSEAVKQAPQPVKKNKKTVKLFWKEVRDDAVVSSRLKIGHIWDELNPVAVDTQKLEHLFESRAKDLLSKKQQEMNKNKEIIVLDPKRSNAINIGMTKLPPLRSIKTAILKMDATIMNREGIEKLLTMLPTKDERAKIQEAQTANPELPLGSAEQFLLTLASISELPARLKLWAFKLDFENIEKEIAEPLMDLKQGIQVLRGNKTFRGILSTLLSVGNFLNGAEVKGFQIEYLSKVPEVKDTVHKHSLLHHLCHIVMEKFPEATDLYSEIGAITRASKVDFDELASNIQKLEEDCKASWDYLKLITKHDGSTTIKGKMSDFLSDCAERIIILGIIHRRITNRFHKFLLWLGIPLSQISDTKPNEFSRIISEFALEYRTTRERVLQQLEKKANHRERNKTRGKMITDVGKFRTKEDRADAELRQLLGSDFSDVESFQGTLPLRRTRKDTNNTTGRSFLTHNNTNGNLTDGDDEILESLVKTATKGPSRIAPRERKRTRHADRKSLRRTLKNGLSEEEKKHLSTYIKGY